MVGQRSKEALLNALQAWAKAQTEEERAGWEAPLKNATENNPGEFLQAVAHILRGGLELFPDERKAVYAYAFEGARLVLGKSGGISRRGREDFIRVLAEFTPRATSTKEAQREAIQIFAALSGKSQRSIRGILKAEDAVDQLLSCFSLRSIRYEPDPDHCPGQRVRALRAVTRGLK